MPSHAEPEAGHSYNVSPQYALLSSQSILLSKNVLENFDKINFKKHSVEIVLEGFIDNSVHQDFLFRGRS